MNWSKGFWASALSLGLCISAFAQDIEVAAAPIAGITAVASTDQETVASSSYSTMSGVTRSVNNMVSTSYARAVFMTATSSFGGAADEYANIGIAQVDNYVNIRDKDSEDGQVVGKLYNKSACNVEETTANGWYKITSGNVNGYVKCEFVVVGDTDLVKECSRRIATVNTETLYVRNEQSTDSEIIGMVPEADDLTVSDESTAENGWIKVSVEEGEGYVSADYVTLSTEYTYAESKAEEEARLAREEAARRAAAAARSRGSSGGSSGGGGNRTYAPASGSGGQAVVNFATQFLGNKYVYGGSSLTNGTDCSGFVMSVYGNFGIGLPHSSSAMRSCGYGVSTSEMQPGDIVCYSGHVGIYTGGGTIISASNPRNGIKYDNVNYRKILAVRRIY